MNRIMVCLIAVVGIFFSCFCKAETLNISNNTISSMSLQFYYNCLNISPSKFNLQPLETQPVTIIPDTNNQCSPGRTPTAALLGGQPKFDGASGFLYLLRFSNEQLTLPWTCDSSSNGFSNYCYYFEPNTDPSYYVEISDKNIDINIESKKPVLLFSNQSNITMNFQFSGACIDIIPNQFKLSSGESEEVKLNIDFDTNCPPGQKNTPVFELYGTPSAPGQDIFLYEANYTNKQLGAPWTCVKTPNEASGYYCYSVTTDNYVGYNIKADDRYIVVLDAGANKILNRKMQ